MNPTPSSPAARGYRHPAEWERHAATWIAWPHSRKDWPGKLGAVPWAFAEMARKLAPGERVRLFLKDAATSRRVASLLESAGIDLSQIDLVRHRTNRSWTRDMGPIFAVREGRGGPRRVILRFEFTAWARYPDWQRDRLSPEVACGFLDMPLLKVEAGDCPVVMEGGAVDVNGRGSLLTTEECLLDPDTQVRNPGFTRLDWERVFADNLASTNAIWLGRGIVGDDTHGHVDDVARFVNPTTVVLAREKNDKDVNFSALQENWERLQDARLENGRKVSLVPLPMPAPVVFKGRRLPASYANFYIGNAAVIVPTFNDANDRLALGILGDLFPDRPVVGIHAVDLVLGRGSLHCLTHEEPEAAIA